MKKILLTILFIAISSKLLACTCMSQRLLDRYAKSEFVATLSVLSVDSETDDDYLLLDIEIIELYKGNKTNLLKIRKSKGSGCPMYAPENTKWLIFASKDQNGNLIFGKCSGPKQLDRTFDKERFPNAELNYSKSLERKLELLETLKEEKIEPINTYNLYTSFKEESLEKFKRYTIENGNNAFYEITVNADLSFKNIKTLKEFDNEQLSNELIEFIKKNIHIGRIGKLDVIPEETKIILGLHYHSAEKERKSVILPYAY
jgi:hypothetical protein